MDASKSDIIISLAGRDKDQFFFVLDADETYVYIADGRGRKIEQPKRKKHRHVRKVSQTDSRVAEKIRNGDKVANYEGNWPFSVKNSGVKTKGVN